MNISIRNELHSKFNILPGHDPNHKGFYYEIINGKPHISDTKILEIVSNFEFPKLYKLLLNVNKNNYLDINNVENNLIEYNILEIIRNDYEFLKPNIEIIDIIDGMFDDMYYGKIISMIEMCKSHILYTIEATNGYKYHNMISRIIYYRDDYGQFDPNEDPDELNIYNMGLRGARAHCSSFRCRSIAAKFGRIISRIIRKDYCANPAG